MFCLTRRYLKLNQKIEIKCLFAFRKVWSWCCIDYLNEIWYLWKHTIKYSGMEWIPCAMSECEKNIFSGSNGSHLWKILINIHHVEWYQINVDWLKHFEWILENYSRKFEVFVNFFVSSICEVNAGLPSNLVMYAIRKIHLWIHLAGTSFTYAIQRTYYTAESHVLGFNYRMNKKKATQTYRIASLSAFTIEIFIMIRFHFRTRSLNETQQDGAKKRYSKHWTLS